MTTPAMRGYLLGISAVLATLALGGASCSGRGKQKPAAPGTTVTLFALAELRGQIEPCGCTTDPLGDLARTAQLVAEARAKGPTVVVDAGSLLYSQPVIADQARPQEELKADLLARLYQGELGVAAVGLGPHDLAGGKDKLRLPRHAANVAADAGLSLEAPEVIDAGGIKLGVFGVVDPARLPGVTAGDPVEAARRAVAQLREAKVAHIVGLASMGKKEAAALARAVDGIDVLVVAAGLEAPLPEQVGGAEQVGSTWLVVPTDRGQVVARLELTVRGDGPLVDAIGTEAAARRRQQLQGRIGMLDVQLAEWARDPTADQGFVAARQRERDELAAEEAALARQPLRVPARGSYFQLAQVRIAKGLACDGEVVTAKQEYAKAAGAANVAAAASIPPVPVPEGAATYVGNDRCNECHEDAVTFWKTTRHAGAWETLEKVNKQFDYDCTGCHATGWGKPGGSSMAAVAAGPTLRDVGCETCHGPGSIHVVNAETEDFPSITLVPKLDLCASECHTPEHSDTFNHTAYLRDVVGPGHGEHTRDELGPGPTGRELREAGLARAGAALGAGCPK